jgi:hypothetical protein
MMAHHDKKISNDNIQVQPTHWPGMSVRKEGKLVEASLDDQAVAREYPHWPDKGQVSQGIRLTVMTKKRTYLTGEEIRVIHVFEAVDNSVEAYVMGPKPIYGEYIDGKLVTHPAPDSELPWVPTVYDGAVIPGPAIDYNFNITSYKFSKPGKHQLYWQLDGIKSNVLEITVVAPKPSDNDEILE